MDGTEEWQDEWQTVVDLQEETRELNARCRRAADRLDFKRAVALRRRVSELSLRLEQIDEVAALRALRRRRISLTWAEPKGNLEP